MKSFTVSHPGTGHQTALGSIRFYPEGRVRFGIRKKHGDQCETDLGKIGFFVSVGNLQLCYPRFDS